MTRIAAKLLCLLLTLFFVSSSFAVTWWFCMDPSVVVRQKLGRCPWKKGQYLYRYSGSLLPSNNKLWIEPPIPLVGFQTICSHSPELFRRRRIMSVNFNNGNVICSYLTIEGNIVVLHNPKHPVDLNHCYYRKDTIRCRY